MSESESEFYGLLRHNYTVDVRFTYLLSVSGNVGLFMVGLMRLHCIYYVSEVSKDKKKMLIEPYYSRQ